MRPHEPVEGRDFARCASPCVERMEELNRRIGALLEVHVIAIDRAFNQLVHALRRGDRPR